MMLKARPFSAKYTIMSKGKLLKTENGYLLPTLFTHNISSPKTDFVIFVYN